MLPCFGCYQGGIGPAGLSTDDLHVLDLTQAKPRWHRVVVQGPGPGPRYGHVMSLVGQRFLLSISGNDGELVLPRLDFYIMFLICKSVCDNTIYHCGRFVAEYLSLTNCLLF